METNLSEEVDAFSFIKGGGEMAALTRNYPWHTTSIGNSQHWPQSLRTALSILINSKFPMLLWWGKDLIQFYNDAYRPSLGDNGKHPAALGQRGKDCWPEIWPVIKPLIDQVLAGESTWSEDQLIPIYRNGRLEDVYWTFGYSPVQDETGKVEGVLVVCNETTGKVKNIQELQVSDQRFQNLVREAAVGIVILTGKEMSVSVVNDAYGRLINRTPDELLGKPLFTIIPEAEQPFRPLLDKVRLTGEPLHLYDHPYFIYIKGERKEGFLNVTYQPYKEADGTITGVMALCHDVTEQVVARKQIEESEHRFKSIIEESPIATTFLTGSEMKIELANEIAFKNWGKDSSIIGKPLTEAMPELKGQNFLDILNEVYTTGKAYSATDAPVMYEINGVLQTFYFDFTYKAIRNAGGNVYGILSTRVDVTEKVLSRKAVEESESKLRKIILQAPVAMCILSGPEYVVEIANDLMLEIWGKKQYQMIGKPMFEGIPEAKGQGFEMLLENVYQKGETYKAFGVPVALIRNNTEETIYVDFVFEAFKETDDKITGIMAVATEVTEQMTATKKIEESEQQVRSLVESAPFPIGVYTGREMRIQLANEAILKVWSKGYNVIGKLYSEILPELDNQQIFEQLDEVFTTGVAYHAKNQRVDIVADGKLQPYYFNYSFTPLFDAAGKVYGVMNTAADVTDLNLAKQKIEESELFARSIFHNSIVAQVAMEGRDMRITTVNENMLAMLGRDASIIGKPFMVAVPELIPTPLLQRLRHVLTTGQTYYQPEERIDLMRHGQPYTGYYNYTYQVLKNTAGENYGVVVTATEVTEQVIARKKTEESEARFRLMADAMPQQVWTGDPQGNLNYYNQAVYDYSGLNYEQIQKDGWLQIVHPDDREENVRLWLLSMQTGNDFIFHHRFRNKNGDYRWQLSRAVAQRDSEGNIQLWIGTSTDIHEHKLFEEELNKQVKERTSELENKNSQLERINKELEQFTYAASHDMQEPLRKVHVFSTFLLQNYGGELNERGNTYLTKIGSSVRRMKSIIDDLLNYSHQTRNDQQFVPTDLNKLIDEIEADLELVIQQKNVTISKDVLPQIIAVPAQMNQLFFNLYSNALKFSKTDTPVQIDISYDRALKEELVAREIYTQKPYIKISFTDNGIGFEQQYADQIFSLFKRLHGRSEYEGTGIGLGLCKKIVENHNGAIWAESVPGNGAAFYMMLPALEES